MRRRLPFVGRLAFVFLRGPAHGAQLHRDTGDAREFLAASFSAVPPGPVDLVRWTRLSCRLRFDVGRRSGELRGGVLRPATAEDVWLSDRYRREVCPVRESGDLPTAIGARLVPHGAGSDRYRREVLSPHAPAALTLFSSFYVVSVTVGLRKSGCEEKSLGCLFSSSLCKFVLYRCRRSLRRE